ncbi:hypothetical protein [Salinisphaera sp.]|uniref:hypothetical protein n=1 Tax=Salinisphaera sp. TaxID=1914330 RepID=UPI000C57627D|nr:hypothetical protein [Salinisphaera sp.]MAS10417.1 hypothetical protein [Salinisphaera sp.]
MFDPNQSLSPSPSRFVCEIGGEEYLIDADTFEAAAQQAAQRHAAERDIEQGTFTVNVAEANEADFPLIAGNDYTVTLPA